jgi:release factor glutamine methyltransferase
MGELLFLLIRDGARRLEGIGAGNPRLEAEYLMAAATGVPRIRLWLVDSEPDPDAIARFQTLLARRLEREPLQYVLGTADFAGLTLEVGPGVFIPRSETEMLVERVADRLRGGAGAKHLIDVGTGCGAILLGLLARFPEARGVGIDRASSAIAYSRRNAERTGLADRAALVRGDLLSAVRPARVWDGIVSNPPYVLAGEGADLSPEIRFHEPPEALFGGEDGLDVIRSLIPEAAGRLRPGGWLAIEIGITQGSAVLDLVRPDAWDETTVEPDLTGRPRIFLARRR